MLHFQRVKKRLKITLSTHISGRLRDFAYFTGLEFHLFQIQIFTNLIILQGNNNSQLFFFMFS
jgi:hypothetical protein